MSEAYTLQFPSKNIQSFNHLLFNVAECSSASIIEEVTKLPQEVYGTSAKGILTLQGVQLYPSLSYLANAFDYFVIQNRTADYDIKASEESIAKARTFLYVYARGLYSCYKEFHIEIPTISGLPDGSLDLEWRTRDAVFVINFNNADSFGYYYGELFAKQSDLNGKVQTNSFETYIASFLQENFEYSESTSSLEQGKNQYRKYFL